MTQTVAADQRPGMTTAMQLRLAADWAVILQSEQAAMAVDREVHEAMLRTAANLARQAAMLNGRAADAPPRPAGTDAAARSPAVDDAPPAAAGGVDAARDLAGLG